MGRPLRLTESGYAYHILNRGNARRPFLHKPADYDAFLRVLAEAKQRLPMRVLAYCLMPNHWHLVVWPPEGADLSRFVGWLTLTHTQRWHAHYHNTGTGHLYQGRFKSFPIQEDEHFYSVCRYVERNALRAGLTARAEEWPWGSLALRAPGAVQEEGLLSAWPVAYPHDWVERVNEAQTESELQAIRRSVRRGQPFGSEEWVSRTAARFQLEQTLRPQGRPPKPQAGKEGSETQRDLFE